MEFIESQELNYFLLHMTLKYVTVSQAGVVGCRTIFQQFRKVREVQITVAEQLGHLVLHRHHAQAYNNSDYAAHKSLLPF